MPTPIEALQAEAATCDRCRSEGLLFVDGDQHAHPLVWRDPPWPVRVMVVAEAPNAADSLDPTKQRITCDPKTDPTGAFMCELLASVGLRPEQVLFTNSVLCLPARRSKKYPVSARQLRRCGDWLGRFIETANPEVVIAFGRAALQALDRLEHHGLALRESAGKLHAWRERLLLPLYHPGLLGRITRPSERQKADILVLRTILERPG